MLRSCHADPPVLRQLLSSTRALYASRAVTAAASVVRKSLTLSPEQPMRRIKLKIKVDVMTKIIEAAVKEFNLSERKNQSIKKTFKAAGQDIWDDWDEVEPLFEAHLDGLAKLPLYANIIENQTSAELHSSDVDVESG